MSCPPCRSTMYPCWKVFCLRGQRRHRSFRECHCDHYRQSGERSSRGHECGTPRGREWVAGDPLTIRIIQSPRHGTLIGTLPFVNYQPNSNFVGTDVLTYVANDGQVDSSVGTLTFIVLPLVSINNVSVIEGSFSAVGVATFSVTLSAPSTETVAVNWATRDGTAKASSDYTAASGTLFFLPGVQQQTIRVSTITDRLFEPDETFFVDLSHGSINFDLSFPGFGTGTIVNDDLFIGEAQGIPPDAIVKVGERFVYGVKWTHPVRWRLLD